MNKQQEYLNAKRDPFAITLNSFRLEDYARVLRQLGETHVPLNSKVALWMRVRQHGAPAVALLKEIQAENVAKARATHPSHGSTLEGE